MPTAVILVLSLLDSCLGPRTAGAERGHDPWVFRSVLDEQARMVTLALGPDFWVAYHTDEGALYKLWRDGVEFDGAVYTTRHGPQPTSLGPAWMESHVSQPWRAVTAAGDTLVPAVRYLGHRFEGARAFLDFTLTLPDGHRIELSESPEYIAHPDGYPGLERVFTVAHLPAGMQLCLQLELQSLRSANAFETSADWTATARGQVILPGAMGATLAGYLCLPEGRSQFTAWLTPEPTLIPVVAEAGEVLHPGLALIEGSDCKTCHNEQVKTVGPAYVAIAERYETTAANVALLARKIMRGGAGVWGEQAMTAHPDLTFRDATTMVGWILTLDGEPPLQTADLTEVKTYGIADTIGPPRDGKGVAVNVYQLAQSPGGIMPEVPDYQPVFSGVLPAIHAMRDEDFGPLAEGSFFLRATGYLNITRPGNYVFRLISDDGSILSIDGQEVINHDGNHGPTAKDGEILLTAGAHPFVLDFYEAGGGQALSLQWIAYGEPDFSVVPPSVFTYEVGDLQAVQPLVAGGGTEAGTRPGDGRPLVDVHPSFRVETIRPENFQPKVGGLDFLPDGRLVLSTWDPDGSVWIVDNYDQGDRSQIRVKRIASGLAEPLGLKVVDGDIFVLQKQELTQLIDTDGDDLIDIYRTVCNGWRASANFHEFAFGLAYRDGYFYGTLATAILPGGASAQPQIPDRGKVVKISRADGSFEFIAHGLRTPNGIGLGRGESLFVADNQGDWLPASKIVHVEEGAWFGSRSVDFAGTAGLTETLPVVWLPQDEIGNSPSQPVGIEVGPYAGQLIHGEVTHGGIKRVYVEEVGGALQGAVFRFIQGLEAGVNRLVWGPDDRLYVGGVGNPGNWGHAGKLKYGLQRLTYTGAPVFEMLAVKARPGGFLIEFTEPLAAGQGESPDAYGIRQWYYQPTANYGGPKLDERSLPVSRVEVAADRKSVFLAIPGLKAGHVVYFRLGADLKSEAGRPLWSTEAWYTLNRLPAAL